MNPALPTSYGEAGRWVAGFATSHAKREDPRAEVRVEMGRARERRSFGLRIVLGDLVEPPPDEAPLELGYEEVVRGRARVTWCADLATRIRQAAARLADRGRPGRRRSA